MGVWINFSDFIHELAMNQKYDVELPGQLAVIIDVQMCIYQIPDFGTGERFKVSGLIPAYRFDPHVKIGMIMRICATA